MSADYQLSAAYIRTVLLAYPRLLQDLPAEFKPLLTAELEHDFIDGKTINQLFEAVARKGVTSWVAEYGDQIGVGNHGPLGFAALSAPNLQTAISIFVDYSPTRSSGTEARFEESAEQLHICLENKTGSELAGRWLIESTFLVAQKLIETIMAHPLGGQSSIHFAFPKPEMANQIESLFHAKCFFNQPDNRLSLPASWATVPSPLHDEETFLTNLAKAREIKLQLNNDKNDALHLVKTRLLNHFDRRLTNTARHASIPSLETLSRELNMSSRTLIRKLDKQGSSYRQILNDIRFQQAQRLLTKTHLTAGEIADKLGYQEPANFGRAFRAWTGSSPTVWRRGMGK